MSLIRKHILSAIIGKEFAEVLGETRIRTMLIVGLFFPAFLGWQVMNAEQHKHARQARSEPPAMTQKADGPENSMAMLEKRPALVGAMGFALGYGSFLAVMLSMTLAIESFVGEKERRTMEVLLATPASDGELFFGKTLSCLMVAAFFSILFSGTALIAMNALLWWNKIYFPFKIQGLILGGAVSLCAMGSISFIALGVIISSRVSSLKAANQVFGLATIVLTVILMLIGYFASTRLKLKPMILAVYSSMPLWALVTLIFVLIGIVDAIALSVAVRTFNRERIMTSI
jgi:ABC-type Na+ efflux pump permease subunit